MAEQIKMLFVYSKHSWGPWNVVLERGADPPQRGRGKAAQKWAPKGKKVKSI